MLAADERDRIPRLASSYLTWESSSLPDSTFKSLSNTDLEAAFHASAHVLHYIADYEWFRRVNCLYAELRQRRGANESVHLKMHSLLIKLRMFAEANALRASEGLSVGVLPKIDSESRKKQGILRITGEGGAQWVPWLYTEGIEIVAYVSPTCAHSRRAMQAIINEPRFRWLDGNVRFVVPRSSTWPATGVEAWNALNPLNPLLNQAGPTGWEALDVYETPVFHLVSNGKRLQTIVGWQREGAELLDLRALFETER
ncbi:TPA: hypothetical protein ACKP39_003445 [Stenotrophomonas maltophilia]